MDMRRACYGSECGISQPPSIVPSSVAVQFISFSVHPLCRQILSAILIRRQINQFWELYSKALEWTGTESVSWGHV